MMNSNYYQRGYPVNRIFRINQFFVMVFIILIAFSGTACNRKIKEASQTSDKQQDTVRRYLAIDKSLHGELRNVQMVMGQATDQKVIFEKFDNDWQKRHKIDGYEYISGVIRDDEGKFRIYYNVFTHKTDTNGVRIRREAMAVAFSDDGINWIKPELNIAPNLVDHPSSNLINIESHPGMNDGYWYRSGPVFYDKHAPKESRYKLSWRVGKDIYVSGSSDGLNFITYGLAINHTADTQHAAFYDPIKGKYVMYGRKRNDWETDPKNRCGVALHSSENWTDIPWTEIGKVVIDPMDIWDYSTEIWPNVYTPSIQVYHGQYIGLPSIFFIDTTRHLLTDPKVKTGLYYPIVIYSHDGIEWTFPDLSHPIIDLEPHMHISTDENASFKGKEASTITSSPNFIEMGDQLYIYYAVREGNYEEHQIVSDDPGSINVAFMRMDGFASIRTQTDGQGEWITSDLKVPPDAGSLHVNADVAGNLQVEVLDAETGKPIKGLGLANSLGVTGDNTNFIMKWKDGTFKNAAGRDIRLRFVLEEGAIYSFFFQTR